MSSVRHCWIDTAPLIASPQATGRVVKVTVLDEHSTDDKMYCASEFGSYLYVSKSWLRPAPDARIIESPAGSFFVRYGDDRAAHGPFKSHALALAYASRGSHTDTGAT